LLKPATLFTYLRINIFLSVQKITRLKRAILRCEQLQSLTFLCHHVAW